MGTYSRPEIALSATGRSLSGGPLGDPGGVHERGQAEQFRAVGQPGHPQPLGVQAGQAGAAGQRPGQRGGHVLASGVGPPVTSPAPANAAEASSGWWQRESTGTACGRAPRTPTTTPPNPA